ncbi:MAG: hypothetical protein ACRD4B_02580 [Acidobacteriota bacterium]
MQVNFTAHPPARELKSGEPLYRQVRAGFILRGTTLAGWCRENGVTRQYAEQCLHGLSVGAAAQKLSGRIARAAGVIR